MAFFRRWFIVWFTLVLGGGQLLAATREERTYDAAVQAFQDKFYSLSQTRLNQYLQLYRKSTNAPAAVLLLAQSQYYLSNYPAAANQLSDPDNLEKAKEADLADQYAYWLAEAQYAEGNLADAAKNFTTLADDFPKSPLAVNAVVEASSAYGKLGDWPKVDALLGATNSLFQHAAQFAPTNEQVANGYLLQAESKCNQGDFAGAVQILGPLSHAKLGLEQDWKRADLLYRANLGRNDFDQALAATTNMLQIARLGHGSFWASSLAESVSSHAGILEKQGRLADAAAAWQENLLNPVPAEQQQQAVLKLAELAIVQTNLVDAETGLEKFLSKFPNAQAAGIALLTLGELYLKDYIAQPAATNNRLATAQSKFDQFLNTYTNSPLAGKAYLDRGWCFWLTNNYADSFNDFQSAARLLQAQPVSEDLAVARFKMGDAQFALNNFTGAQTNYEAVLTEFAALPHVANSLGGLALYQILRVRLALHDATGAEESMNKLLGEFLTNAPAESSLLLAGQGVSDYASPAKARELFARFEVEHTNSVLLPQVVFAISRTYEREQNWGAAVTNYQAWLTSFPTNDYRPQVEYARNWSISQSGNEQRAFELFTNYLNEYTNNTLTPLAYWWVADHYFRLGSTNFVEAERNYQLIFQNFPTNELADRAQLMAGRAALGWAGSTDASRYFVGLMTNNCPEDLHDQAVFGYCEALRQMASSDTNNVSLQQATNYLAQLTPKAATNLVGAMAWCETADCNLQMGALDAATNAFLQALNSPVLTSSNLPPAGEELRARALVGLGIVLEKKAEGLGGDDRKALLDLALQSYQNAFYSDYETKSEFWTKKAGLQILALAPKNGALKASDLDNFISRLEELFPQLKDSLELKRSPKL